MAARREPLKLIQAFARDNNHIPQLQFILNDDLEIDELNGNGLVNYIWKVNSKSKQESLIIKYGEEQLRVAVEGQSEMSLDRQVLEYNSLKLLNDVCPGSVPKAYCFDDKHHIIAMEELEDMELLGDQSRRGKVDVSAAARIGKLQATYHNKTYKQQVSPERWDELERQFGEQEMKDVKEKFAITAYYTAGSPGTAVPEGGLDIYRRVLVLAAENSWLEALLDIHRAKHCFIHADCHDKHVALFNSSDRVALLDLEFAYLGHPVVNLAETLVSYPLVYFRVSRGRSPGEVESLVNDIKQAVTNAVSTYLETSEIYKDDCERGEFLSKLTLQIGHIFFAIALFAAIDKLIMITASDKVRMMKQGGNLMNKHGNIRTIPEFVEAVCSEIKEDESL